MARPNRNALRRLQRILNNEEYGPQLARLKRNQEREVLRLIEENKGREARSAIQEYTTTNRTRRVGRPSHSHPAPPTTTPLTSLIDTLIVQAANHIEATVGFTGPYGKYGIHGREHWIAEVQLRKYQPHMMNALRTIIHQRGDVIREQAYADRNAEHSLYWYHTG